MSNYGGIAVSLEKPQVYAVKNKDEKIVADSRSGGIFTTISDAIFDERGVVYGSVLNEHYMAEHIRAEDIETRNLMRGSKYIQSKMGDTYSNVKRDLADGRKVLFSGTSCQVAGLKKYLGKEYDNLICIDILCHGVPSPRVWKKYLEWQEKRAKSKVNKVNFRNKTDFGWRAHVESLWLDNGKTIHSQVYRNLFFTNACLRPCCYECKYKGIIHPGDITIGDYWKIEKAAPEFDDNKGVSLVLINNEKGAALFEQIKENITFKQTRIEDSMQPALVKASSPLIDRTHFWNDFYNKKFDYIARKYGEYGCINKIKKKLKRLKNKIKRR